MQSYFGQRTLSTIVECEKKLAEKNFVLFGSNFTRIRIGIRIRLKCWIRIRIRI
jgi:hypothetical protein